MAENLNLFGIRKKRVMGEGEQKIQWPGVKYTRARRFLPVGDFYVQAQSFLESGRGVPPCPIEETIFKKLSFINHKEMSFLRISSKNHKKRQFESLLEEINELKKKAYLLARCVILCVTLKMDKIYYQPNHLCKGQKAVKKLAENSKEKPDVIKQWLSWQAFWQVHLPAPKRVDRPHYQVTAPNEMHQFDHYTCLRIHYMGISINTF